VINRRKDVSVMDESAQNLRPARGRRRSAAVIAAALGAVLVGGLLAGCAQDAPDESATITLGVDTPVTTYNANTVAGAYSGARQAFGRVLTGLSYLAPDGSAVADRDYGAVEVSQGAALTLLVRINPEATYSDGVPVACDDLVLAWAAGSGTFRRTDPLGAQAPMFDAASDSGLADIEAIDCEPGSKEALVRFKLGRPYADWRYLFGATTLMPAHVAARAAGVPDIPSVVAAGDTAAMQRIADFWNTGWQLEPGNLDLSLFPSSGPYMIESYTAERGLVLVPNPNWWGNSPRTPRIVIWSDREALSEKLGADEVDVVDVGANSIAGVDLYGFDFQTVRSLNSEQLVFNTRGLFGPPEARRAFAACVPRQRLVEEIVRPVYTEENADWATVLNSRVEPQASHLYAFVAATAGDRYLQPDLPAATARPEVVDTTIRIGYVGPDPRREETVSAIARACEEAGIVVQNVSAPGFDARAAMAAGEVEIVLGGDGGSQGAGGSLATLDGIEALRSGSPLNIGAFANPRIDEIIAELAVTSDINRRLELAAEAEGILWNELPTLPLFEEPRTIAHIKDLQGVEPNVSAAGVGWNMDRWVKAS
jgi:peptide/nickel transport system substrate-binding protein